jgi:uncharacterized protein
MTASDARRSLAVYLALVAIGTAAVQITIARRGGLIEDHVALVFALMWTPTFASLITRLVFRQSIRDVSFRFSKLAWIGIGISILFPIAVGLVAYGGAWITGLAAFNDKPIKLAFAPQSPAGRFLFRLLLSSTIGVPLSALTAMGEEIGWRGFMVTRLVDSKLPRPLLISGVIWGLWHVPLILTGQYAAGPKPWLSAIVFLVSIVPFAYFAGWLRLRSGSVWPAIAAHAAWNSTIQGVFDVHTRGGGASRTTSIWVGESGLLVAATSVVLVWLLVRGRWTMRRNPRDEAEPIAAP